LLFAAKRARPDIQTAIAFLCTRVKAPDVDDYKKLSRVVKYLLKYPRLALTLETQTEKPVRWFVDASFGVHGDMKSHTGGCGTLGRGMFCCVSKKQKLNTRSSTEAELIGVDNMMGAVLWCQKFLKGQGRDVKPATIYQDNQGAILLEKNGSRSSSSRTRHVDMRYYFVTDCIEKGEIQVEYCPTSDMCSDALTKPLQGNQFRKLRAKLLNIDIDPSPIKTELDHRSVLEMKNGKCGVGPRKNEKRENGIS
jgi:hypothetical protein